MADQLPRDLRPTWLNWFFGASLVTAWEVPATPWLSVRWSIELGAIVSIGAGLLFDTSLGPVIRF